MLEKIFMFIPVEEQITLDLINVLTVELMSVSIWLQRIKIQIKNLINISCSELRLHCKYGSNLLFIEYLVRSVLSKS